MSRLLIYSFSFFKYDLKCENNLLFPYDATLKNCSRTSFDFVCACTQSLPYHFGKESALSECYLELVPLAKFHLWDSRVSFKGFSRILCEETVSIQIHQRVAWVKFPHHVFHFFDDVSERVPQEGSPPRNFRIIFLEMSKSEGSKRFPEMLPR